MPSNFSLFSEPCKCYAAGILNFVVSGFCYSPQKSVSGFVLAITFVGFKRSLLVCSSNKFSSFILIILLLCDSWVSKRHGQSLYTEFGGFSFLALSLFGFFPLYFPGAVIVPNSVLCSSDQKAWVSAGETVVPSSSDYDLSLGEKPPKQETFPMPPPSPKCQLPSTICPPSSLQPSGNVSSPCVCGASFHFVFYAEFMVVSCVKCDPVGV